MAVGFDQLSPEKRLKRHADTYTQYMPDIAPHLMSEVDLSIKGETETKKIKVARLADNYQKAFEKYRADPNRAGSKPGKLEVVGDLPARLCEDGYSLQTKCPKRCNP